MGEFLAFIMIVFSAVWGSVFLAHLLKQSSQKLGFFKELRAPDGLPGLPAPDAGDDAS